MHVVNCGFAQILSMDGDALDTCSLAAQVALECTRIPRTEAIPGESGLLEDFEVIGDIAESTLVETKAVPIFVTIAKVSLSPQHSAKIKCSPKCRFICTTHVGGFCAVAGFQRGGAAVRVVRVGRGGGPRRGLLRRAVPEAGPAGGPRPFRGDRCKPAECFMERDLLLSFIIHTTLMYF